MFPAPKSLVVLAVAGTLVVACGQSDDARRSQGESRDPGGERVARTSPGDRRDPAPSRPRIIVLGDSLTAGLGLPPDQSFPALLQARLDREGYAYEVVNAGVSGDTSAGGARRLEWALGEGEPHILIVALGGNDGLRGLPPEELEKNLAGIIEQGRRRGLTVILAGMEAPPNNGPEYVAAFRDVYRSLAHRYDTPLIPFLLESVAGEPEMNQPDGIHPNARGARIVADTVWRVLEPALSTDSSGEVQKFNDQSSKLHVRVGMSLRPDDDPAARS